MNMNRRGGATTAIVACVALVLVGGLVWYFVSDPFHTKVNDQINQMTKWTPEQIAKDPVNYLNYCEAEATKAVEKLKASTIQLEMSRNQFKTLKTKYEDQVNNGSKAVRELAAAYSSAEAANAFPVQWQNKSFEKDDAKKGILRLSRQIESTKKLLAQVESGLANLSVQEKKIDDAKAAAQEQLAQITQSREMLKVNALSDTLKKQLVDMQGVLVATVNIASEKPTVPTLDQLADQGVSSVDEAEFQKALNAAK